MTRQYKAFKSDKLETQIAHDLLRCTLVGNVKPVLALLRQRILVDKFFNHDLPMPIYNPEQASRQPKHCLWCFKPLSEEDIQDQRGVCWDCRKLDDKMAGLEVAVRTPDAGPENPNGLMARVGDLGLRIRSLCSQRFGSALTELELLQQLQGWLLDDGYVDDNEQLARMKLIDVLELLSTSTKNTAVINSPMPRQSMSDFAKRCEIPIEVLRAIKSSCPIDWAAAVYVYQVARDLSPKVPKPSTIHFIKLELAIGNRHEEARRQNGIIPFQMVPFEDPRYELGERINAEFTRELATLRGLMPPGVSTPAGWEGEPHSEEITTPKKLREYLEDCLDMLRTFGIANQNGIMNQIAYDRAISAIRNALRVFDHLRIDNRPNPWPTDPTNAYDAERALSDLILWLRTEFRDTVVNPDGSKRRPGRKATYETTEREAQIASDWEQARTIRIRKLDFAKDKKMALEDLDALLDRVYRRKTRSDN